MSAGLRMVRVDSGEVAEEGEIVAEEFLFGHAKVKRSRIEDRIIETYIHNLSARVPRVIEKHLQEAGFLHVSRMHGRIKLEPALISTLLERWRLETHIPSSVWRAYSYTQEYNNLLPTIRQCARQV
ncbi:uncharacterized protein LOC108479781 [Gossypium arboreum]|uniref:uncharacterized protein LOC108479781 n=1 Tax=Gossypium arboreum TaxID=29729 RepID=UPI0008192BDE|nr:uncharacterized protein LOC108479781 [Gossypium arboreum]